MAGAVEQWPAGVAGIEGSVGLNHVFDHASTKSGEAPPKRANDTGGDRELESERRSHCDRNLTRTQVA